MPYDTLLTCRHFKYVILYTTTTHVLCVYTPMQCALSCICLCHVLVCAGSELASVLQIFTVLVIYSWCLLIIPLFSSISLAPIAYFIVLQLYFLLSFPPCPSSAVLHLFSALLTSPSLLPPFTTQLLTGCIYHHPKEAQQPQSPGTAAAGLVVHKQALRTTTKCVGVVSLVKPSQTCHVVEMFISDVQNESTTTSVKLLALISIGNRQTAGGRGHVGGATCG